MELGAERQRSYSRVIVSAVFVFFAVIFFLRSDKGMMDDPGLGWHLRIADRMWETRGFLYTEEFSLPSLGLSWVAYAWLGDIVMWFCDSWGGLNTIGALTALNFALVLRILQSRMTRDGVPWVVALMWTSVAAFGILPSCTARPNMFTFVGLALTVATCERFHTGAMTRKQTLWLLPLFLFWTNMHSGFLCGILALLTTYFVEFLLAVLAPPVTRHAARSRLAWWTVLGCILFLVTLINPNGIHLYEHLLRTVADPHIQRSTTTEWLPPDFAARGWFLLESVVLLFPFLAAVSRRRPSPVALALCLVFLHYGLIGSRYTGLWIVIAVPTLANLSCAISLLQPLRLWLNRNTSPEFRGMFARDTSRASLLPGFAFAAAFLLTSRWLPPISAHDQTNMPTVALDKLLDAYRGERVFHSVNWGGYLTWHGRDLQPPFMNWIDDRLEVHGPEHLADYRSILNAAVDWDKKLDAHRINLVCLPTDAQLVGYIRRDPRWTEIYSDQHAVIYRRSEEPTDQ